MYNRFSVKFYNTVKPGQVKLNEPGKNARVIQVINCSLGITIIQGILWIF